MRESIVDVPFVTASLACVEDCASFVCGSELASKEENLFFAALFAWMIDEGRGLHVCFGQGLDVGSLVP